MAVFLSPVGGVAAQFFTNTGAVLTGGKLYTYAAGTTTPLATYTSASGATYQPNPIVLDAAGRVPNSGEIWLTDGVQYKFVLKDSNDVLIATYDNIIGINSNFVNYTNQQEIQTATAGQTVFTLTTMQYQPATGSLSVFVGGVNQYGPGSTYSFQETSSTVVTFTTGLHVGASVKFTTSAINASSYGNASQIAYTPAGTGAVATNVQAKLRQTVSVMDFGAVGDGVTDDRAAIVAAMATGKALYFSEPAAYYNIGSNLTITSPVEAGLYQIFSPLSAGDVTFSAGTVDVVYPEWWGAVRDGTTDDYAALQAAIDSFADGGTVQLQSGTYGKSAPLSMPSKLNLNGVNRDATTIINTVANVGGIVPSIALVRKSRIANLSFNARAGDTTNIGILGSTTTATVYFAESIFENVGINGFQYGFSGGDEFWENTLRYVRSNSAVHTAFRFIGSSGSGGDNVFEKCYANASGVGGFYFSTGFNKSIMINCTVGTLTGIAIEFGTNVFGFTVLGGNVEDITLVAGGDAIRVGSASVVTVQDVVFQGIVGPSVGKGTIISVRDTATVNVSGCAVITTTGNVRSFTASNESKLYVRSNRFPGLPSGLLGFSTSYICTDYQRQVVYSPEITLSAGAVTHVVVPPNVTGRLMSARVVYSEATSADAGVNFRIGADNQLGFNFTGTTSTSTAQWTTTNLTLLDTRIGAYAGDLIVTCAGGKTGAGKMYVVLEFYNADGAVIENS